MKAEAELNLEILCIITDLGQRYPGQPSETVREIGMRAAAAGDPVALVLAGAPPDGVMGLKAKQWAVLRCREAMAPGRRKAVDAIMQEARDRRARARGD